LPDEQWRLTFDINITGNYLLADQANQIFSRQNCMRSSCSPVRPMPSCPSAAGGPTTSVDTVVTGPGVGDQAGSLFVERDRASVGGHGSAMFPRDRVIAS
jgi:hypothetical protein